MDPQIRRMIRDTFTDYLQSLLHKNLDSIRAQDIAILYAIAQTKPILKPYMKYIDEDDLTILNPDNKNPDKLTLYFRSLKGLKDLTKKNPDVFFI